MTSNRQEDSKQMNTGTVFTEVSKKMTQTPRLAYVYQTTAVDMTTDVWNGTVGTAGCTRATPQRSFLESMDVTDGLRRRKNISCPSCNV